MADQFYVTSHFRHQERKAALQKWWIGKRNASQFLPLTFQMQHYVTRIASKVSAFSLCLLFRLPFTAKTKRRSVTPFKNVYRIRPEYSTFSGYPRKSASSLPRQLSSKHTLKNTSNHTQLIRSKCSKPSRHDC